MNLNFPKLQIKKRTLPEWLTYYILFMPLFELCLIEFFGFPNAIRYTVDAVWVFMFALIFFRKKVVLQRQLMPFLMFFVIWLLYTFVLFWFNFKSPLYYLWGLRNNFRYYAAFIIFAVFLEREDIDGIFKLLDILFWINAAVALFQFYALGYKWDYLGGIFGVSVGVNSNLVILFTVVLGRSVLLFMRKQEKTWVCCLKCFLALYISSLAEIKFFFVIFILITVIAASLTKFSWQKLVLLIAATVFLFFANTILVSIFGEGSSIDFERLQELILAENYSSQTDLGRFTAVPTISERFFPNTVDKLFGMGLGNCDTSAFAAFNTPFYQEYQSLNYIWFSSAFVFLETGYVGLVMYFAFFILCFINALRLSKQKPACSLYCQIAMVTSAVCCVLIVYNSSLRTDIAYLMYFALALPVIACKGAPKKAVCINDFKSE